MKTLRKNQSTTYQSESQFAQNSQRDMCQHLLLLLALVASLNSVQAQQTAASTQVKSIGFCLAGDSTTASNAGMSMFTFVKILQTYANCV
jgi:hypothetical protein